MIPIDIHTHHFPVDGFSAILNCYPDSYNASYSGYCSVGIHPWNAGRQYTSDQCDMLEQAVVNPNVLAIGEVGLDKLCDTPFDLQQFAFRSQAQLAHKVEKPLLLHVVKAIDEVLAVQAELNPNNPWVLHGFRGNGIQAAQLVRKGFFFSFGKNFNSDALRVIPLDRLFVETDEASCGINEVVHSVSEVLGMTADELLCQVRYNVQSVFLDK